jgi:hypothetical protein
MVLRNSRTPPVALCRPNLASARLHFLDDLILVLALMNRNRWCAKTDQISRDAQFGVFQLR